MFVVVAPTTKPMIATALEAVMCQVRSLSLPERYETPIVLKPAMRYYWVLERIELILKFGSSRVGK